MSHGKGVGEVSHGKGIGQVSQNDPRVEFFFPVSLARQSNKHCRYMDKEQSPSTLE